MLSEIKQWLSDHSFFVGTGSIVAGLFSKTTLVVLQVSFFMTLIAHITTVIGFAIALITLCIKVKEAWDVFRTKKGKK